MTSELSKLKRTQSYRWTDTKCSISKSFLPGVSTGSRAPGTLGREGEHAGRGWRGARAGVQAGSRASSAQQEADSQWGPDSRNHESPSRATAPRRSLLWELGPRGPEQMFWNPALCTDTGSLLPSGWVAHVSVLRALWLPSKADPIFLEYF